MDTELRKRLEEAAKKYADENYEIDYSAGTTPYSVGLDEGARDGAEDGFLAGAEFGYKEAIAQAKEWIRNRNRHACKEWLDKECADFERDMNELWEEEEQK